MEITQEYAVLIIHSSFQSRNLLKKIEESRPGSPERDRHIAVLDALKECLSDHIRKTEKEIVEAFRRNKAAQMILEMSK